MLIKEYHKVKLHLGCGKRNFGNDWIHIDGSDYPHVKYHSIEKLEFSDELADLIYASHVLEYFDRDEVVEVLKEWRRVLKPGGTLRLAVPDFGACAKLYVEKKVPLDKYVGMFYGKWKITEEITAYHKTIYDHTSLEKVLNDTGFENVRKWDWREVEHGKIDDFSQAYLPHMDKDNGTLVSLNLECDKK